MEKQFSGDSPESNPTSSSETSVTDCGNLGVFFFLRFRFRFVVKLTYLTELQRCKNVENNESICIKLVAKYLQISRGSKDGYFLSR